MPRVPLIPVAGSNFCSGASHVNSMQVYSSECEFNALESDSDRHNDVEEDDTAWILETIVIHLLACVRRKNICNQRGPISHPQ